MILDGPGRPELAAGRLAPSLGLIQTQVTSSCRPPGGVFNPDPL